MKIRKQLRLLALKVKSIVNRKLSKYVNWMETENEEIRRRIWNDLKASACSYFVNFSSLDLLLNTLYHRFSSNKGESVKHRIYNKGSKN